MVDLIELDDCLEEIDTVYLPEFHAEDPMAKPGDNNKTFAEIDKRLNALETSLKRSASIEKRLTDVEKDISKAKGFWLGLTIAGCIVALATTGAMALTGWCLHDLHQLDVKVGEIQQRLKDGGLGQIVASLVSNPLGDQIQAEKSLGVAATILKSVKTGATPAEHDDIKTIAKGISNAQMNFPGVPQVWEASAAFISYRSRTTESAKTLIDRAADKKNCSYSWGKPSPSAEVFKNCEVSLEEVAGHFKDVKISTVPASPQKTSPMPHIFYDSVIHYHGGDLPDGPMYFYNCIFLFDVQDVPSGRGAQTLEALTNIDNLNTVHIGE
jgi:hypothetical protein